MREGQLAEAEAEAPQGAAQGKNPTQGLYHLWRWSASGKKKKRGEEGGGRVPTYEKPEVQGPRDQGTKETLVENSGRHLERPKLYLVEALTQHLEADYISHAREQLSLEKIINLPFAEAAVDNLVACGVQLVNLTQDATSLPPRITTPKYNIWVRI